MILKKIHKYILIFFIITFIFETNYEVFAATDTTTSNTSTVTINSEAALLIEKDSGNILYEKNSEEKLYPASTTKIMTAILAIENCDLKDIATVSQNAVNSVPSGYTNARIGCR